MTEATKVNWQEDLVTDLIKGLDESKVPELIDKGATPDSKNVNIFNGALYKDTGYSKFAQILRGTPRKTYQFIKKDTSDFYVCLTDATFYVYNVGSNEWDYVSDGVDTTLSGALGASSIIPVVDRTGFSANQYVGLMLSDGTQHKTTIVSGYIDATGAGNIAVNDPTPSAADSGAVFLKTPDFTGSPTIQVDFIQINSDDKLIITNGVDNVKVYDGTTIEDLANLPASGNTQCKALGYHNNHLLLLNTTEGGISFPYRIRNSDTGNIEEWSAGNAGFEDLYDTPDHIVGGLLLGPYFIIYKAKSIIRQEWVGSDDLLFSREDVITNEGLLSKDGVVDLGDHHIFVGNSNFYRYRGGFDLEPIGDQVYNKIFNIFGDLNPQFRSLSFMLYAENSEEIWFFYASIGEESPKAILKYSIKNKSWIYRELKDNIVGYGIYQRVTTLTWNTIVGTWNDQVNIWNANALASNLPSIHLCGDENLRVYEYDYSELDDDGVTQDCYWESKDFFDGGYYLLVDSIILKAKGTDVYVDYSIDAGVTWTNLDSFTSSTVDIHKIDGEFSSKSFRFRVRSDNNGFQLNWFKIMFTRDSLT